MKSTTKIFGCIADPINHVKAPSLFTSEFIKRNIDAVMIPINASKENLKDIINGLKKIKNFYGLTVTIPHKIDILKLCDKIEVEAHQTGAVNWIKFSENLLIGNNFDGLGFVAGLNKSNIDLINKSVCVFGAGGAGMAISFALLKHNIKELKIINRDKVKGKKLIKRLKTFSPNSLVTLDEYNDPVISDSDIIINATSIGLKGNEGMPFKITNTKKTCLIADIIMDPEETLLIKEAKRLKKQVHLGKYMLENQIDLAGKYFHLW